MKKIIVVLLILALIVIGGCSDDDSENNYQGNGEILGAVENLKPDMGQILPVQIMVIEENPTKNNFDPNEMTIIAETTVENDDNSYENYSYNLKDIPAGEYYIVAFKDLNGNGQIDFLEDGPLDAGGYFGKSEESEAAEKVVVSKDQTVTGLDFPINSVGYPNFFSLEGLVINLNEERIEGVEIELYGSAGIKVHESIVSNSQGSFKIDGENSNSVGIVDGEYYIKASLEDADFLNTITPYFIQKTTENETTPPTTSKIYWSIDDTENDDLLIGNWQFPTITMITQKEAEDFGYTAGASLIGGDIGIENSEVIITPENGNIGYLNSERLPNYSLETSQGHGYIIKDVAAGDYNITAEHETSDFYEFKLTVAEDTFSLLHITELQ